MDLIEHRVDWYTEGYVALDSTKTWIIRAM
jgi:hypothetical protein